MQLLVSQPHAPQITANILFLQMVLVESRDLIPGKSVPISQYSLFWHGWFISYLQYYGNLYSLLIVSSVLQSTLSKMACPGLTTIGETSDLDNKQHVGVHWSASDHMIYRLLHNRISVLQGNFFSCAYNDHSIEKLWFD